MSPLPPSITVSPTVSPSPPFNMEQINQINTFFSSTPGIITFSAVWLICVVGLFCVTGYLLTKQEDEEDRANPDAARQRERQGLMIFRRTPSRPADIELPTICTNEESGNYHRLL
uniref:Col_cuticle_N domain-containing protein n=1 Tax=Caenorhabditis tropicalis TaxID=1561998 RepID=A0A1I7TNC0_9PELO